MTKKKAAWARKEAWSKALAEGRVVKLVEFDRLTSYPTIEQAQRALKAAAAAGLNAHILAT